MGTKMSLEVNDARKSTEHDIEYDLNIKGDLCEAVRKNLNGDLQLLRNNCN